PPRGKRADQRHFPVFVLFQPNHASERLARDAIRVDAEQFGKVGRQRDDAQLLVGGPFVARPASFRLGSTAENGGETRPRRRADRTWSSVIPSNSPIASPASAMPRRSPIPPSKPALSWRETSATRSSAMTWLDLPDKSSSIAESLAMPPRRARTSATNPTSPS